MSQSERAALLTVRQIDEGNAAAREPLSRRSKSLWIGLGACVAVLASALIAVVFFSTSE